MHPILFTLGPLTIYSYGVCVAAAFLVAILTAAARARRFGWNPEVVYDISIYVILGALGGSRLLYILENPAEFAAAPFEVFKIWRGGLNYYGGLIGAIIAAVIYLRARRLGVAECFDILMPSLALGHAIGRIGCLLNGCCFGAMAPPSLPWAVVFPEGSVAHSHQLYEAGVVPPGCAWSLPVHPTQIYEVCAELGIFFALTAYLPRKRFNGEVFWLYLLLYGAARFAIEFFRGDNPAVARIAGFSMSSPQLASLAMAGVSGLVLLCANPRGRRKT